MGFRNDFHVDWLNLFSGFFEAKAMETGIYDSISIQDYIPFSFNSQFDPDTDLYSNLENNNNVFYVGTLLAVDTSTGDYQQVELKAASGILNSICDGRSLQIFDQLNDPAGSTGFGGEFTYPFQFLGLKFIAPGIADLPVPTQTPSTGPPDPGMLAGYFMGAAVTDTAGSIADQSSVLVNTAMTAVKVGGSIAVWAILDALPTWTTGRIVQGTNIGPSFTLVPGTPELFGVVFAAASGVTAKVQLSNDGGMTWTNGPAGCVVTLPSSTGLFSSPTAGWASVDTGAVSAPNYGVITTPGASSGFPWPLFGTVSGLVGEFSSLTQFGLTVTGDTFVELDVYSIGLSTSSVPNVSANDGPGTADFNVASPVSGDSWFACYDLHYTLGSYAVELSTVLGGFVYGQKFYLVP